MRTVTMFFVLFLSLLNLNCSDSPKYYHECEDDFDCNGLEYCVDYRCRECADDYDCPGKNKICNEYNFCTDLNCETDSDCPDDLICTINNICMDIECIVNNDCDINIEFCNYEGKCENLPEICAHHLECPNQFVCNLDQECEYDPYNTCTNDFDCMYYEFCNEAQECELRPAVCKNDDHCDPLFKCLNGQCISYSDFVCESDSQCDESQVCYEGICRQCDCLYDSDCGLNYECDFCFCVPITCFFDSDCFDNTVCVNGYCDYPNYTDAGVEDTGPDMSFIDSSKPKQDLDSVDVSSIEYKDLVVESDIIVDLVNEDSVGLVYLDLYADFNNQIDIETQRDMLPDFVSQIDVEFQADVRTDFITLSDITIEVGQYFDFEDQSDIRIEVDGFSEDLTDVEIQTDIFSDFQDMVVIGTECVYNYDCEIGLFCDNGFCVADYGFTICETHLDCESSVYGQHCVYTEIEDSIPPGSLIKGSESMVYYYNENGTRHAFPDETTFLSWFPDYSMVQTITDSELADIPIGVNVTIREGTYLIKITSDPKVYAIEPGGIIRWIETEDLGAELYGVDWRNRVYDVPDHFFTNYYGGSVIDTPLHPVGTLITYEGDPNVYLISAEREKRWIVDENAFEANYYRWEFVVTTTIPYLDGEAITGAEPELIYPIISKETVSKQSMRLCQQCKNDEYIPSTQIHMGCSEEKPMCLWGNREVTEDPGLIPYYFCAECLADEDCPDPEVCINYACESSDP